MAEEEEEVMNKQVILNNYVEGFPKESDMRLVTDATIRLKCAAADSVLLKNLYLSCDPVMRILMRNPGHDTSSYFTPYAPGSNYNAKLSDFGLAKLGPTGGDSDVSTRIIGTYGYAAPEYIATGHLYVKSDVYGFGVVLLEILTGLRALDTKRPKEQVNLVDWTRPLLPQKRKLKTIMDARMEGQYSLKAAIQTANITLDCLDPDRSL